MSDPIQLRVERSIPGPGPTKAVTVAGDLVVCGGSDGDLVATSLAADNEVWRASAGPVMALATLAQGVIAVATRGEGLWFYTAAGDLIAQSLPSESPNCLAVDADGHLWSGDFSGFVHRSTVEGTEVSTETMFTTSIVEAIACTASGLVVTAGSDELVMVRQAKDLLARSDPRAVRRTIDEHSEFGAIGAVVTVGEDGWASGGWNGEIVIVEPHADAETRMVEAHRDSITGMVCRGTHLVSVAMNSTVRVTNIADPEISSELKLDTATHAVAAVDDRHVAIGTDNGAVILADKP